MAPTICEGCQIINLLQHLGRTSIAGLFRLDIFYIYRLTDIRDPFYIFFVFFQFLPLIKKDQEDCGSGIYWIEGGSSDNDDDDNDDDVGENGGRML
jgi:hypothetical protein